jgi:polyphosphate kinase
MKSTKKLHRAQPKAKKATASERVVVPLPTDKTKKPHRTRTKAKKATAPEQAVVSASVERPYSLSDPSLYINRELSLLEFQRRVLEEAQDEQNPLLERVRFLAIVFSNMNEFFMVRVAGLRKQLQAGVTERSPDGMTPAQQLAAIRKRALELMQRAQHCFKDTLRPQLDSNGIHILSYDELSKARKQYADTYFRDIIYPVLTPLAYDLGRPFPHISNLSLNLGVIIRDAEGMQRFARIKVPESLPRLLPLKPSSGSVRKDGTAPHNHYFVWLEQVIAAHVDALFPGMKIVEVHPFHITRDADMVIQELEAADLLEAVEESIRQRRFGSVGRLSIAPGTPHSVRGILLENMDIDSRDLYTLDVPLIPNHLMSLYAVERPDLKFAPFVPSLPAAWLDGHDSQVFDHIQQQDIFLHHPYDSFTPVINFLWAAAEDPQVLAIKQTLYRVGTNSPIVKALLKACQNGKQVSVLVELKARFDEESNIEWARKLEQEGVHVVYGLLGLKTHSKVALVVRKEGDHIRRYVHLATGNYNHVTAYQYEDLGLFTADADIGADVSDLFNYLTGYSAKTDYRKLLVAPVTLRQRLETLVRREIQHAQKGRPAHVIFKTNALVDTAMIRLLYEASQAGVRVDLIVRGICCLKPGIPDMSERIRVISIVGRFLEHSRIYYFHNVGAEELYIGSADLMPRNLDHRVEVLFPIESPKFVRYLRDEVLETCLADNHCARLLQPDVTYQRLAPGPDASVMNVQQWLLNRHGRQTDVEERRLHHRGVAE